MCLIHIKFQFLKFRGTSVYQHHMKFSLESGFIARIQRGFVHKVCTEMCMIPWCFYLQSFSTLCSLRDDTVFFQLFCIRRPAHIVFGRNLHLIMNQEQKITSWYSQLDLASAVVKPKRIISVRILFNLSLFLLSPSLPLSFSNLQHISDFHHKSECGIYMYTSSQQALSFLVSLSLFF